MAAVDAFHAALSAGNSVLLRTPRRGRCHLENQGHSLVVPATSVALMKNLTEAPGPSGFEAAVREIVVREFEDLDLDIQFDGLGSVLAYGNYSAGGPRVMVTAHLDEVGLMVQHINARRLHPSEDAWRMASASAA